MASDDLAHQREYDTVRADYPTIPPWEELTEDQKEKVRQANREKWRFFQDLGEAVRTGGELPKINFGRLSDGR